MNKNNKQSYLDKLNTPLPESITKPVKTRTMVIVLSIAFSIFALIASLKMGIKDGLTLTLVFAVGGIVSYWLAIDTAEASEKHPFGPRKKR
ncbi:hypothetical protein [Parendozoicomonas haliclonae]|uniref:Uncharacterized protein n=1 Tax=Parendozoicomonas haliclonae TaxID=1960125 RepID=A0A1X7AH37_9GAMM|nr:hypothetical protein [Parendozoicomonas haliclonae]SMA40121.1 hypothetical protein EHSB41UT_01142 [Parendozoicomonas haliclonae]